MHDNYIGRHTDLHTIIKSINDCFAIQRAKPYNWQTLQHCYVGNGYKSSYRMSIYMNNWLVQNR